MKKKGEQFQLQQTLCEMKIEFSDKFQKKLQEFKRKNKKDYVKIKKALQLFEENHRHPSLRTHKLTGNLRDTWSISAGNSLRLIYYIRVKHEIKYGLFFMVGTHDEVYR